MDNAGETEMGMKHLAFVKKSDALQLNATSPDDPKVQKTLGQMGDPPIRRVIAGSRTSPALVSALYLICSHFGIALDRIVVADWGIYTVGAQPPHL